MAAETKDTVWMGFMDVVPVIGTVKESVELVLAVYEGDKAVIKEKEKAVENFVKESLKKHMKKPTPADKPAATSGFSGLRNVTEVRKEKITEYVMKGSKRGTKPPTAEQKERQRKVETIQKDMLEKIRLVNQNFSEELKEQLGRSNRGEHVFNNGILTFHSKVLNTFIQKHHIDNLPGYNQQAMDALGKHTLPQNTAEDIQTNMVVHFDKDEFYVNANGVMYGQYCRALSDAMLAVLDHRNKNEVTDDEKQRVNDVIDNMNNLQIYVDEMARDRWIGNNAGRRARFEQVRQQVADMYKIDRGFDWCIRILDEVAPLFGY